MDKKEFVENIPNYEKNEILRKQIEKCKNPSLYSKIFKYRVYQKYQIQYKKLKKLYKKRLLSWEFGSNEEGKSCIIVTGRTIGGTPLETKYYWSGKYGKKYFYGAIAKWSRLAFDLDSGNVQEHLSKILFFENFSKENVEKYPKSSAFTNELGYKLVKYSDIKDTDIKSRTLIYSFLKEDFKIKIKVIGINKNGKEVSVETRGYDETNDTYLVGAIRKWYAKSGNLKKRHISKCKSRLKTDQPSKFPTNQVRNH